MWGSVTQAGRETDAEGTVLAGEGIQYFGMKGFFGDSNKKKKEKNNADLLKNHLFLYFLR